MTSGSLLRGHLRPAGARHPPFLVIGLVLIIVILAFNYWNLNGEYQAITKEIDELQDNLHMAMLKKDNAERQYEVYEKRFRETDAKLGKEKMAAEHKDSQIAQAAEKLEAKADEVNKLQEQLNLCQQSNGKLETSSKQLEEMQARFKALEAEKEELARENEKMVTVIRDLKIKQEEMAFHQASLGLVHTGSNPVLRGALLNARRIPGQLKPLNPRRVRVVPKGVNGITVYMGGPLMPNLPDDEDLNLSRHKDKEAFNNEANVLPPPGNEPAARESAHQNQNKEDLGAGDGVLPLPETPNKRNSKQNEEKTL